MVKVIFKDRVNFRDEYTDLSESSWWETQQHYCPDTVPHELCSHKHQYCINVCAMLKCIFQKQMWVLLLPPSQIIALVFLDA